MRPIDEIITDPPLVHSGGSMVWALGADVLGYLDQHLPAGAKTLETGCGASTVVFAQRSAQHTCIVPAAQEIELLRAYCGRKEIALDHVEFIADYSQNVLPGLPRKDLDLVLVDGGHGFPVPAIDWFFTAPMLRIGGTVIIDDVQLWTGLELKQFLREESAWEHVCDFSRSVAYKKLSEDYAREWIYQPYTLRKSRLPQAATTGRNALKLLLQGKFSEFVRKARKTALIR